MRHWIVLFTAVISGLIFGFGLILSGMVNPAIVLAFLDIAGHWNASLLWVMSGAMGIAAVAFHIARRRSESFLGLPVNVPTSRAIDQRLLSGSFLFGAGWGTAGFCPGPALIMAGAGSAQAIVFVIAMLAGMLLFEIVEHSRKSGMVS